MPKRVAIVVDTFPRWSERFIARELSELLRNGVDFNVFCLRAGSDPPPGDIEWDGLIERRVVLPTFSIEQSVRAAYPELARRAREVRAAIREIKPSSPAELKEIVKTVFKGEPLPILKHGCVQKLIELLREGKFQHVHAHFANLPSTIGWLAAKEARLPFSLSVHARDLFVEPQSLEEKLAFATRVFTCHRRATEHLGKIPTAAGKIIEMHHGLPLQRFQFRERAQPLRKSMAIKLLAAGRFVPKKGFHYAVGALRDEKLAGRNVTLTLLGDGPERQRIAGVVNELKLSQQVTFISPSEPGALTAAFESAHAFLAPYEVAADGDSDGISNVILEAFALGVPVIGTDAGGLKEVLAAETGFMVPQKDPAAIAQAIIDVANHPDEAQKRARAARKLVEEQFDISRNIRPLLELF
jgi:glycosyltransferase involved in cell wall biosynthesis